MPVQVNKIVDWVAEVVDLDCADVDRVEEVLPELKAAFRENHVLVFRDQDLSPSELSSFSRFFGIPERAVNSRYLHPDNEDVLILSNEIRPDGSAVGVVDAGEEWHSDSSHEAHPAKATILQSVRKPQVGGDTLYCNMHEVYDGLSPAVKDAITGRFAEHHNSKLKNPRVTISENRPDALADYRKFAEERKSVLQPMVRTHPETGRQSLYVSPRFTIAIDGMDDGEAQPLLDVLFDEIINERFHYRHKWSNNDLVMWDNRCLNHMATGGVAAGDIRRMHRTVLRGDDAYFDPEGRTRRL